MALASLPFVPLTFTVMAQTTEDDHHDLSI